MRKVIRAKGLIDVNKEKVVQDPLVIIEGDKITAVGTQKNTPLPQGPHEILDFSRKYILPGLINSHAHMTMISDGRPTMAWMQESNDTFLLTAARNGRLALRSGVTTVRDCGGRDGVMFALRKGLEMGIIEGPRFFLSGRPLTSTGGHAHHDHGEVDGPEEVKKAARQLFKEGADFIKLMATGGGTPGTYPECAYLDVPEIMAAVEVAQQLGKKVAAHCRGIPGMVNCVEAGINHMEHAEFQLPGMKYTFDPKLADRIAKMGMYVTPTIQLRRDSMRGLAQKKETGTITPLEKKRLDNLPYELEQKYRQLRGLLKAGVRCVAGDDAGLPFTPVNQLWLELDAMVEGGMKPVQAIVSATRTAAEAMDLFGEIGSITVGKQADLIVVDGDPTAKVSALSKVSFVMKAGKVYLHR
jgi:imidazolonepropionase-like amidohydrolase